LAIALLCYQKEKEMRNVNRVLPFLGLLLFCSVFCAAQIPRDTSASVSGHVKLGGKGAVGITVVATTGTSAFDNKTVAKTTTDDEGNYRITGLSAGRFTIIPLAKAFVETENTNKLPGQTINVVEGESITKIDFALVRGGVITGRITDSEGDPLIGERINIVPKDTPGSSTLMTMADGPRNKTDDRGIYRIYGLAPGSYKVSVGQVSADGSGGASIAGFGGGQYAKTFYPGTQDESKATAIEVKEGSEITGIDITPGQPTKGFSVSGTVIDSESGQPVANVFIGYSSFTDASERLGEMSFGGHRTDANGKFRLEGVRTGRYAAFTLGIGPNNTTYSDPTPFDVSESDVTGVEIKVKRGASVSGVAVIENNSDPAIWALLQTLSLNAHVETKGAASPSFKNGQISSNGSFRFDGLSPGRVRIGIQGFPTPPKGLTLLRTEVDGVDQEDGIELAAGAQVSGVRLVFAHATGSIRGEVKIEGGVLPEGASLQLSVRAAGNNTPGLDRYIEVDARGRFVSETIPPGTYELTLRGATTDPNQPRLFEPVKRTITVANGTESRVIFVVDLAANKAGPQ
jgi:protocatechuate 3,4-dioxygenase beta subunit